PGRRSGEPSGLETGTPPHRMVVASVRPNDPDLPVLIVREVTDVGELGPVRGPRHRVVVPVIGRERMRISAIGVYDPDLPEAVCGRVPDVRSESDVGGVRV